MELALAMAVLAPWVAQQAEEPVIRVLDRSGSCYHHEERAYEWRLDGGRWIRGDRSLTREQVDAIREIVLASTEDSSRLLVEVGITPQSVAAHRDQLLETALKWSWRNEQPEPVEVPEELRYLLEYEYVAEHALGELIGRNWASFASVEFEVQLPGDPVVRVRSEGLVEYMLPWTVQVGGREWKTPSVEVSRAMLLLAAPDGPAASLIDGSDYWPEEFWRDTNFWHRWIGSRLDDAFSSNEYAALPGYLRFSEQFLVEDAMTGHVNMHPLSMFLEIRSRYPSLIDEARWYNFIVDGEPGSTWLDFLHTYADALAAAHGQPWLLEWKISGPDRSIGLELAGARGIGQYKPELFVHPPWRDAAFTGQAEFQLLLRRGGEWCATVYLATDEPGALIETAHPAEGEDAGDHWLDHLEVSYHPTEPEYARVDAAGECEVRRIE